MDLFSAYDPKDRENLWNRARALTEDTGQRLSVTLHVAAKEAGFHDYYGAYCYWKDQLNDLIRERLARDQANDDRGDQVAGEEDQEDDEGISY